MFSPHCLPKGPELGALDYVLLFGATRPNAMWKHFLIFSPIYLASTPQSLAWIVIPKLQWVKLYNRLPHHVCHTETEWPGNDKGLRDKHIYQQYSGTSNKEQSKKQHWSNTFLNIQKWCSDKHKMAEDSNKTCKFNETGFCKFESTVEKNMTRPRW